MTGFFDSALVKTPKGRTFLWLWLAQLVSGLGSQLTGFALGVWLYQTTGQATPLFLSALANTLPGLVLSPIAGVIVDRVNRKRLLMLTDTVQALVTLSLLLLLLSKQLQPGWMYLLLAVSSAAGTFQWPAQSATVSALVPREELGRASGLTSFSEGVGLLAAPLLAGVLVSVVGITGVMIIDLCTFVVAVSVFALQYIPNPPPIAQDSAIRQSIFQQAGLGWRFILERRGLLNLLSVFAVFNFSHGLVVQLIPALVLSRTNNDTTALGLVNGFFGLGVLVGGVWMTLSGGVRPCVHGVFAGTAFIGLFGTALLGLGQTVPVWMLANFIVGALFPIINGSSQAIWQSKVPLGLQGRVFTVRRLIGQFTLPLSIVVAGPLVDGWAVPLMQGPLGTTLAPVLGPEAGRGYALVFVLAGVVVVINGLLAYLRPLARNVETALPDAQEQADGVAS
jgi:MFS transporter, DHA3 family, macrolide efflux protein